MNTQQIDNIKNALYFLTAKGRLTLTGDESMRHVLAVQELGNIVKVHAQPQAPPQTQTTVPTAEELKQAEEAEAAAKAAQEKGSDNPEPDKPEPTTLRPI